MENKRVYREILKRRDQPKELFDDLFNIWREERKEKEYNSTELIIKLNKSEGMDFCQLGSKAIDEGSNVFDVIQVLEKALPYLNLNIETTLELLEKFFNGTQNDWLSDLQYNPIQKLAETQPLFLKVLLDRLIKIDRPFVIGYISNIYIILSKGNETKIYSEIEKLKSSPLEHVIYGMISVLDNLNYTPKENSHLIKKTLKIFNELEDKNLKDTDVHMAHTYRRLLEVTNQAQSKLLEFSKKNNPKVDFVISSILFQKADIYGNESWYKELLLGLCKTSIEHIGIIKKLDYALSILINKKGDWELVERFLAQWLIMSDYKIRDEKLANLYNSTLASFTKDIDKLQKLITRFFNDDRYQMHCCASEIISYCLSHKITALKFDRTVLLKLEYNDLLFMARKVLGYISDPNTLCSLIFSLLDKSPRNRKLQELIYHILTDFIGRDYLTSTIKFLEQCISRSKSKIRSELTKEIINKLKHRQEEYRNLIRLNETIPTKRQTYLVKSEKARIIQRSMKSVQDKSAIRQIATTIRIKYGSGSFSFQDDSYTPILKYSSFSSSFELPASEMFHPINTAMKKIGMRLAKRELG